MLINLWLPGRIFIQVTEVLSLIANFFIARAVIDLNCFLFSYYTIQWSPRIASTPGSGSITYTFIKLSNTNCSMSNSKCLSFQFCIHDAVKSNMQLNEKNQNLKEMEVKMNKKLERKQRKWREMCFLWFIRNFVYLKWNVHAISKPI